VPDKPKRGLFSPRARLGLGVVMILIGSNELLTLALTPQTDPWFGHAFFYVALIIAGAIWARRGYLDDRASKL
jgi:hypothetical protein